MSLSFYLWFARIKKEEEEDILCICMVKQQCRNEKENPGDKISCLPLTYVLNHEISLV